MKKKLLWTAEYNELWHKKIESEYDVRRESVNIGAATHNTNLPDENNLIEMLKDAELYIIGYEKVTDYVLKNSPNLKLILSVRDGPEENIDIEACTKNGIPVIFAGGRCMHSVSEMNFTMMFNLASNFVQMNNDFRQNGWPKAVSEDSHTRTELFEKTIAIIGLGRNGREVARMANGIGMKVIAYDPFVSKEDGETINVEMVSLEDAMRRGDYITVLARITPDTIGMIGKKEIGLMKKTAFFINTGRGKLIDENALLDAIENDEIAGAALDVFSEEPLPTDSRVFSIPNNKLLITPHMAGVSVERVPHQYELLFENLEKFYKGEERINIKNPQVFKTEEFKEKGGKLFGILK